MTRIHALVAFCALLAGCVNAPELPATAVGAAEPDAYLALVPIGPILAIANATGANGPDAGLDARAAALNARAAAMRGPVIDPALAATLQPLPQTPALQ